MLLKVDEHDEALYDSSDAYSYDRARDEMERDIWVRIPGRGITITVCEFEAFLYPAWDDAENCLRLCIETNDMDLDFGMIYDHILGMDGDRCLESRQEREWQTLRLYVGKLEEMLESRFRYVCKLEAMVRCQQKPHWDGLFLTLGVYSWHFRKYPGPIRDLFNALKAAGWPHSVKLDHLDDSKVTDAAKYLNNEKKPTGIIRWHGSADGTFSWEILPH